MSVDSQIPEYAVCISQRPMKPHEYNPSPHRVILSKQSACIDHVTPVIQVDGAPGVFSSVTMVMTICVSNEAIVLQSNHTTP